MLRIGELARLAGISAKALRIYDDLGLLKPATVDKWTGYRYYSIAQLADLHRILALKDFGFSLDQIAAMLREGLTTTAIRELLKAREQQLQDHLSTEHARLTRIQARLHSLEQETTMPQYEIVRKQIDPLRVASLRTVIPDFSALQPTWDQLYAYLARFGLPFSIPNLILWHETDPPADGIGVEVAAPLPPNATPPDGDGITTHTLPGGPIAALVHHGPYDTIGDAYAALYQWLEDNNYQLAAPTRQLHLAYAPDQPPTTYITELQFPLQQSR